MLRKYAAAARLHARDQMPRGVDMRHDVDRPALRKRLVGGAAGIHRQRIEAAADAGVGTKQRNRAEFSFGFLDDVDDVLFLADIAFERRAIDRGRDRFRAGQIEIGDHDLGRTGAMKGLAERAPDAVGAAGDNHDLAGHLHRRVRLLKRFRPEPDRARRCNGRPRPSARNHARSRSGNAGAARRERSPRNYRASHRRR